MSVRKTHKRGKPGAEAGAGAEPRLLTTWKQVEKVAATIQPPPHTKHMTTMRVCFMDLMRCIWVSIRGGHLVLFASLENVEWRSPFDIRRHLTPKQLRTQRGLIDHIRRVQKRGKCRTIRVEPDARRWTTSLCYVNPAQWFGKPGGMHYHGFLFEMVQAYVAKYGQQCPDVDLILNRKDTPLVHRRGLHPWRIGQIAMPTSEQQRRYGGMGPVLSFSRNGEFRDVLMPTEDEWKLSAEIADVEVRQELRRLVSVDGWRRRRAVAVFRGSLTGCGTTPDTNQRLRLAVLGASMGDVASPDVDAGVVGEKCRLQLVDAGAGAGTVGIEYADLEKWGIRYVNRLDDRTEQIAYKYIIHVDGNVSAYRLCGELARGFVVLVVKSLHGWHMWYEDQLQPWKHYVPVKADLSDLREHVQWCREHDTEARRIAIAGQRFALQTFQRASLLQRFHACVEEVSTSAKAV